MPHLILLDEDLADTYKPTEKYLIEETVSKLTIIIMNKHATKSLKYRILVYADKNDVTTVTLVAETTLAALANPVVETLTDPYDAILIQMKNAAAGETSTGKIVINWV